MPTILNIIYRASLSTIALMLIIGLGWLYKLEKNLPDVDTLRSIQLQVPLKIYSQDQKLIAQFGEGRRDPVKLNELPPLLIKAVLATEDARYYQHSGVDLKGMLRALVHLITNRSLKQGGSTITMQVARNFFLTRKKTFDRKINEILLALKIEQELTKDEILELYLNKIYFGKRAYGIEAAAEVYYGKKAKDLSLAEMAMLAGLPQAPSSINPLHDQKAAYKRRKHVLERMLSFDFITETEFLEAVNAPLPTQTFIQQSEVDAPYVAEMVRQELYASHGDAIYGAGLIVHTTINSLHQEAANHALRRALLEYDQRHGYKGPLLSLTTPPAQWLEELQQIAHYNELYPAVVSKVHNQSVEVMLYNGKSFTIGWNGLSWARKRLSDNRIGHNPKQAADILKVGDVIYVQKEAKDTIRLAQLPDVGGAFVSLEPNSGAILGLIGGFDYSQSNFNRATQAERQPGSSFKPFIYAAALNEGYTLASIINDAPIVQHDPTTGATWRPRNDDNHFKGPIRLKTSLALSQNMVTIKLLQAVGISKFLQFAENLGFDSKKLPPYASLALGAASLTPLELASGYAVFANNGQKVKPYLITKITDYQGKILYSALPSQHAQVLNPQVAFQITLALQEAINKGTGQRAKSLNRRDLAGKTGTTNEKVDAWYAGYNQQLVAIAWVGFDEPKPLKEYGSRAALPMWIYYMEEVLKTMPEMEFTPPAGMVSVLIDPATGLLARRNQNDAILEYFPEELAPREIAPDANTMEGTLAPSDNDSLF